VKQRTGNYSHFPPNLRISAYCIYARHTIDLIQMHLKIAGHHYSPASPFRCPRLTALLRQSWPDYVMQFTACYALNYAAQCRRATPKHAARREFCLVQLHR